MANNYKIKSIARDFIVNEVSLQPDYCRVSNADYSYIWVKKVGMTSFEAIEKLKEYFLLEYQDICAEGLKDEDGTTSQLISLKKIIVNDDIKRFNEKFIKYNYNIEIDQSIKYGITKLSPRQLHGNTFRMVIRNINKKVAEKFFNFCYSNRYISFINYYDSQRFGIVGCEHNTHLIGKAIVENNWIKAYKEYKKSGNNKKNNLSKNILDNNECKNFFINLNSSQISFFISAYDSYIWNKEVSKYIKKMKNGKECDFPIIGKLYLNSGNIIDSVNVFSVDGHDFNEKSFQVVNKRKERNLFVGTTIFPQSIENDDLNPDKYKVTVSFFLPTGCYATMLIRQIFFKLGNNAK